MRFDLLMTAPFMVQIHLVLVIFLLLLGGWLLWRQKGTPLHKALGKLWAGLMVVTAIHSFFMSGGWNIIHILSVWTLFCIFKAVTAIRRGEIKTHRDWMTYTYIGSLVVAGSVAALMPGRLLNQFFLG